MIFLTRTLPVFAVALALLFSAFPATAAEGQPSAGQIARVNDQMLMRQDLERIVRTYAPDASCDAAPDAGDARASAPAQQLVNIETNTALRASVGEGYDALRSQLAEELISLVDWLQSDCDDMMEIAARCHKFASSAALFGAEKMRQVLIDIEIAGKAGDNAVISVRREMLPALLHDTLAALDQLDTDKA